jgi:hypothetical protein
MDSLVIWAPLVGALCSDAEWGARPCNGARRSQTGVNGVNEVNGVNGVNEVNGVNGVGGGIGKKKNGVRRRHR